jgi:hypothetical protein
MIFNDKEISNYIALVDDRVKYNYVDLQDRISGLNLNQQKLQKQFDALLNYLELEMGYPEHKLVVTKVTNNGNSNI